MTYRSSTLGIASRYMAEIAKLDEETTNTYKNTFRIERKLNRTLVSFQANKNRPFYRWYKFKEAYSADMVEYFMDMYSMRNVPVFDPFAGSGTSLFTASERGLNSVGIELLPIGHQIVKTRRILSQNQSEDRIKLLKKWRDKKPWVNMTQQSDFVELRITKGAYPIENQRSLQKYLSAIENETSELQDVLLFVLLCVLDDISYTRKDGQFLRWDYRSGRQLGKTKFDKGKIYFFDDAIVSKLNEIISDIEDRQFPSTIFVPAQPGEIMLHEGSCLSILPDIESSQFGALITSPPYCNRYDYTRTYAKELAILGINEEKLMQMRQSMLSCTVENREKDLVSMNPDWGAAIKTANNHALLQLIITYLNELKDEKKINNSGIPRMVKGYFYEMSCVIAECSRILTSGSRLIMVNDNVRYAGVNISVDTILSDFASELGFIIENILVLPDEKGNSSQQMGTFGKESLRKCVYVWRKQ
ncbi:MAG: site-specific DNA-methyltransferase [Candidatus Cloacimonetes bacterium]|nr:site-specific DNA-methyltransferase [Candidatus Cloacimonadota bacterium]